MEHHNLMDSRFFSFFTRLADLILLNFIFLLTCLPIVTIGASFAALYQVGAAMADGRESYIVRSYLAEWKKNFKQGTMVWALCAALLLLCRVNLSILPSMPPGFVKIFLACFQFCTLFFLYGIALYSFSMPPIYKASLGSMLKNALVLLFKYLLHASVPVHPGLAICRVPAGSQVGRSGSFYANGRRLFYDRLYPVPDPAPCI